MMTLSRLVRFLNDPKYFYSQKRPPLEGEHGLFIVDDIFCTIHGSARRSRRCSSHQSDLSFTEIRPTLKYFLK